MNTVERVAVTSRSFSKHAELRAELGRRYAHVTYNDAGIRFDQAGLVAFLAGHDKAIVALERIDGAVLDALPGLRVIAKQGVGLDNFDLAALRERGVRLGWTPGTNRRSVAELALCLTLAALRQAFAAHRTLLAGEWRQLQGAELTGKTVGILGFGHIGRDFARLLTPFRCRVLVHDPVLDPAALAETGAQAAELDTLLRESDVVSLHLPLLEATRGLLDARRLGLMRPGAVLINTARGGLVDETALHAALTSGRLGAAGFDVFAEEPPQDRRLIELPNFLATPHISGSTAEAVLAMGRAAIDGLDQHAVP